MKSRRVLYSLVCICLVIAIGAVVFVLRERSGEDDGKLIVVTEAEILKKGAFPVNENGETCGVFQVDSLGEPDLILAINEDGVQGYVRSAELFASPVSNPEEAMAYMAEEHEMKEYTMYLQDGETVVGTMWGW